MNFRNRQRHQEENKFTSINKKVSALNTETLIIIKKKTTEFSATQRNKHTSIPARVLRIFLATAPAATLPIVSLAEDLPPPFNYK